MTHRTSLLTLAAASVAVTMQAASNALYAYKLGGLAKVDVSGYPVAVDGALLAAGSVAVAVFQARAAASVVHPAPGESRGLAAAIMLGCMCYSVGAMSAHVLQLQRVQQDAIAAERRVYDSAAATRDTAREAYSRAKASLQRRQQELAALGNPRAVSAIQADVEAVRIDPRHWRTSKQCSDNLHLNYIREACEPVLALYKERGAAASRADAARDVDTAARALATERGRLDAAERQLAATPRPTTPWEIERTLAAILPWTFAIVVELTGTFGFAAARRPVPATPPAPESQTGSQPSQPRRRLAPRKPDGLHALLIGVADGTVSAPGCTVEADGWVTASGRQLAKVLGVAAPTVSRQIERMERDGIIAVKRANGGMQLKLLDNAGIALSA